VSFFRIVESDGGMVADADSLEMATAVLRDALIGRYHIDEISAKSLPLGHTARRWGCAIRHDDGRVILDPDPWEV
jgi:hypothetical protein